MIFFIVLAAVFLRFILPCKSIFLSVSDNQFATVRRRFWQVVAEIIQPEQQIIG